MVLLVIYVDIYNKTFCNKNYFKINKILRGKMSNYYFFNTCVCVYNSVNIHFRSCVRHLFFKCKKSLIDSAVYLVNST